MLRKVFPEDAPCRQLLLVLVVLNHILRKLAKLMLERAYERNDRCLQHGIDTNDGQGSILIVLGYIHR